MEEETVYRISDQDNVGCFGDFNSSDPICKQHCALRLRCAIERNQNDRLELLDDLMATEDVFIKIQ
jgi:hypothetical protein